MAGRVCRALISLSSPIASVAVDATAQARAGHQCPPETASATSLVAIPPQAKPSPAPSMANVGDRMPIFPRA